jgi:hypothetical protein
VNNRQRLELTSQAAPSIILKEARENIETEPVQLTIKEKFGPDRSAAATSIPASLRCPN